MAENSSSYNRRVASARFSWSPVHTTALVQYKSSVLTAQSGPDNNIHILTGAEVNTEKLCPDVV